jgi:hypothetical protein
MSAGGSDGGRPGVGDRSPPPPPAASLSPVPRRPRNRDDRHAIVVEHVVEKSSTGLVFPTLTRTNHAEWSLVMRVNLEASGLWDAIEDGIREDRSTLVALLRAVPEEMQAGLTCKETAADTWEAIRIVRMGGDWI